MDKTSMQSAYKQCARSTFLAGYNDNKGKVLIALVPNSRLMSQANLTYKIMAQNNYAKALNCL